MSSYRALSIEDGRAVSRLDRGFLLAIILWPHQGYNPPVGSSTFEGLVVDPCPELGLTRHIESGS